MGIRTGFLGKLSSRKKKESGRIEELRPQGNKEEEYIHADTEIKKCRIVL